MGGLTPGYPRNLRFMKVRISVKVAKLFPIGFTVALDDGE